MDNNAIVIDMRKCIKAIIKNIKKILIITLITLLLGFWIALFFVDSKNEYTAISSVYSIVYGSLSDSANSIQAMISYGDIVKSYKVAERAELLIGDDSIDKYDIYNMITVQYNSSANSKSSIIYIYATSKNRAISVKVANAVAQAFVLEVANMTGQDDIQILDEAFDANVSYNAITTRIMTTFLFGFLGFFSCCVIIFFRETFSMKMYSPQDATDNGKINIIGVIPEFKKKTN